MPFDPAFYSTVAQVIPVLLLALLVDMRYFSPPSAEEPLDVTFFLIGVGVVMLVGEVIALNAVHAGKEPSDIEFAAVMAALGFPLTAIGVRMIRPRMRALGERGPRWIRPFGQGLFIGGVISVLVVTFSGVDVGAVLAGAALAAVFLGCFLPVTPLGSEQARSLTPALALAPRHVEREHESAALREKQK
jgi:hypothetical protein